MLYTLIIAGTVIWGDSNKSVPVRLTVQNLTKAECEEGKRTMPQAIQDSWGQKIRWSGVSCRKS